MRSVQMISRLWQAAMATVVAMSISAAPMLAQAEQFIVVASTTSTENSGLFAHLLPKFEQSAGFAVRVSTVFCLFQHVMIVKSFIS